MNNRVNKKLVLKYFENSAAIFGLKLLKTKKGYRYNAYISGNRNNFTINFSNKIKEEGNYYVFKPIKSGHLILNGCDSWLKCETKEHASFYMPENLIKEVNAPYTEEINNLVFNYYKLKDAKKYYKILRQSHIELEHKIMSITLKSGEDIVGFAEIIFDGKYAFIYNFAISEKVEYVDEIKSVLLKSVAKLCFKHNYKNVYCLCNRTEELSLYKLNGFNEMFKGYSCSILNAE